MKFIKIATSTDNISIFASENSFVSFGDSPYFSHYTCSAVDIYPGQRGFDNKVTAYSPVAGVVKEIHKVKPPQRKTFEKVDFVMALSPKESDEFIVRILHVNPTLNVGDYVEVGDTLGNIIRSGYYDFWTDPHMHVEVRSVHRKILTARGSEKLNPYVSKPPVVNVKTQLCQSIVGRIVRITPAYILLDVANQASMMKPFYGISVGTSDFIALLDAGVPYYQYGMILHTRDSNLFRDMLPHGANISRILTNQLKIQVQSSDGDVILVKGLGTSLHLKRDNLRCKIVLSNSIQNRKNSFSPESYLGAKIIFSICLEK